MLETVRNRTGKVKAKRTRGSFPILVDEGFTRVEEIGKDIYAVLSDPSKGALTVCNGGFIVGRESILVIEGYGSPAGAKWVVQAARKVSKTHIKAAVLTHSHWDHSLGIVYYGGEGIDVISHPKSRELIWDHCLLQEKDKSRIVASFKEKVEKAQDPVRRQRAQWELDIVNMHLSLTETTVHAIPNRPLKIETLPMSIDLGGMIVVL